MVLGGSAILLSRVWDSLRTHARGVILAAYGVTVLGFGPVPELRTRRLLEHGVQVQGTVVGAEEKTARGLQQLADQLQDAYADATTDPARTEDSETMPGESEGAGRRPAPVGGGGETRTPLSCGLGARA